MYKRQVSNLVTLHEKTGIGRLSAYCGAVSAGAGAGAGITYLHGGGCREISHTIVNALAVTSGIVCDGAKSSCAAKIAMAVEAGILGFEMYSCGKQFYGGDGLVAKGDVYKRQATSFPRLPSRKAEIIRKGWTIGGSSEGKIYAGNH